MHSRAFQEPWVHSREKCLVEKKARGAGKEEKQLNMRKSHRGPVFTGEEGTLDPGGFGPTSAGQLTGIRGGCAAAALHNPSPESRAVN